MGSSPLTAHGSIIPILPVTPDSTSIYDWPNAPLGCTPTLALSRCGQPSRCGILPFRSLQGVDKLQGEMGK